MSNRIYPRTQTGFSLIELMIAILLGTLLLLGVLQLFSNTTEHDRNNNALARVQESARIGLEFIQRDIRRTSYLGCASANRAASTGTPTGAEQAISDLLDNVITGTEGNVSDTLTTTYAISTGTTASSLNVSSISLSGSISHAANETFLVSDCSRIAIIITPSASASGGTTTLNKSGNEYNASSIMGTPIVWRMQTATYDIRDTGRDDSLGNAIMGLYRNGEEIIEGAEELQVLYGLATSPSTTRWVEASGLTAANRDQIYRVKVSLTVASADTLRNPTAPAPLAVADLTTGTRTPAADSRLRRVFTSSIDLRNRQFLRN